MKIHFISAIHAQKSILKKKLLRIYINLHAESLWAHSNPTFYKIEICDGNIACFLSWQKNSYNAVNDNTAKISALNSPSNCLKYK